MYGLCLTMNDTNSQEPDPFLREALSRIELAPGARVLDLACGRGRHALALARLGYRVEAWDRNSEALAELSSAAQSEGLEIRTRELDCEQPPVAGPFDLVLVFNYLDRTLPPKLLPSVTKDAYLVYCTFTRDRVGTHPSDRWCLEPGELKQGFEGWSVLYAEEAGGRAGIVAQRERSVADHAR